MIFGYTRSWGKHDHQNVSKISVAALASRITCRHVTTPQVREATLRICDSRLAYSRSLHSDRPSCRLFAFTWRCEHSSKHGIEIVALVTRPRTPFYLANNVHHPSKRLLSRLYRLESTVWTAFETIASATLIRRTGRLESSSVPTSDRQCPTDWRDDSDEAVWNFRRAGRGFRKGRMGWTHVGRHEFEPHVNKGWYFARHEHGETCELWSY